MTKYTSGPWRYWTCRIDSNTGMENYVQFANPNGYVFRAPLYYLREEDARLIAAAPDLLEALKAMVDAYRHHDGLGADLESEPWTKAALDAIFKATGEHHE